MSIRIDGQAIAGPELTLKTDLDAVGGTGDAAAAAAGGPDFGAILADGLQQANKLSADASAKTDALLRGASDDIHGTMISSKEADISIKLVGTVRNKLLDAFHELWRINL